MKKLFVGILLSLSLISSGWGASQDFKGTINGNTITAGTGTVTISPGKTITATQNTSLDDTVALSKKANLETANTFTDVAPMTTPVESWIGPSSTTGVYFKGGNVGIGTATPATKLQIYDNNDGTGGTIFTISNGTGNDALNDVQGQIVFSGTAGPSFPNLYSVSKIQSIKNGISNQGGTALTFFTEDFDSVDSTEKMRITSTGNVGIGTTVPGAVLHLKAGAAGSSSAPLKFTSGTLQTTAEVGAVEFVTDAFYGTITTGAARKQFAFTSDIPANVLSGTYTPTATNVTNITNSTPNPASWGRIGNIVTVFGTITITNTLAVASEVDISLPVASNLANATDLNGTGTMDSTASVNLYIKGDTTSDRASIYFTSAGIGQTSTIYYSFQYKII